MRERSLIIMIKKLIKEHGSNGADNILAGMLIVKPDYFTLVKMIKEYMEDTK